MGFGKDGKGAIITQKDLITLGTLNAATAIKQATGIAIEDSFRLIKMEIAAMMTGFTAGEGPIHLYCVNDELSVAEIAEAINAAGPVNRNDRLAQERAERAVFLLGSFGATAAAEELHGADGQEFVVNKTIRWTFNNPEGWSIVAFNDSGATLTTGAVIRFVAKYFGVWVT